VSVWIFTRSAVALDCARSFLRAADTSVEWRENMTLQELRDQIREAFPAARFYGPITPCDCEECTDIREGLRHKRWDEIPTAFLDSTCSPTLLTPEAFTAFIPAYLLRALDNYLDRYSVIVEFTVYSLCSNPAKNGAEDESGYAKEVSGRLERARLMNPLQIQVIREFLVFVQKNAGNAEWFRPFITDALEKVWR
jgi:hypothetical protein